MPEVKIFVTVDGKEYPVTFDRDPSDADIDEVANSIRAENRASQPKPTPQASNTVSSRASVSGKAPAPTTPSVAQTLFGAQTPTPQPVAPQRAVQPQQNLIQQALSQSQYAPGVAQPPKPQVNVQQPKINLASKSAGPLTSAPSFPDPAVRAAEYVNQGMYSIPPEVQTNLIQDLIFRLKHGYENLARNIMTPPQIPGKKQLSFERRPQEEVDKMGTAGKSVYAISDLINSFLPGNLQAGVLGMLAEPPKAATGLVSMASKTGMAPAVTAVAGKLGMKPEELTAKDFPDWLEATLGTGLLALGAAHGVKGLTGKMEAVAEAKKAIADNKPLPPIVEQQIQKTNIAPTEQDYFKEQMGTRGYHVSGFTEEGKPIFRNKTPQEVQPQGETNASQVQSSATSNGNLRTQPVESKGQVPVQEGSQGVRTNETQGVAQQGQAQEVKPPVAEAPKAQEALGVNTDYSDLPDYVQEYIAGTKAKIAEIDRNLAKLDAQYKTKLAKDDPRVPPPIKKSALESLSKKMDSLDAGKRKLLKEIDDTVSSTRRLMKPNPALDAKVQLETAKKEASDKGGSNVDYWNHIASKLEKQTPDAVIKNVDSQNRSVTWTPVDESNPFHVNLAKVKNSQEGALLAERIRQRRAEAEATGLKPRVEAIGERPTILPKPRPRSESGLTEAQHRAARKAYLESEANYTKWEEASRKWYTDVIKADLEGKPIPENVLADVQNTPAWKEHVRRKFESKVAQEEATRRIAQRQAAQSSTPEPVRPAETPVEAPKVEPVRRRVTVNDRTFELTGEAAKRFDEIDAATKAWKEKYKDVQKGTSAWDEYQTQARARAMRDSAEKRQIVGALTAKEAKASAKNPPKTYEGVKETTGQPKEQPIPEATKPVETPITQSKPVEPIKAKEPVKTEVAGTVEEAAQRLEANPEAIGLNRASYQKLLEKYGTAKPDPAVQYLPHEIEPIAKGIYAQIGPEGVEQLTRNLKDQFGHDRPVSALEHTLMVMRQEEYVRAIDQAQKALDAAKKGGNLDTIAKAQDAFNKASDDLVDYQVATKSGQTAWSRTGLSMQRGIDPLTREWAQTEAYIKSRSPRISEKQLAEAKKLHSDLMDALAERDKALAEERAKAEAFAAENAKLKAKQEATPEDIEQKAKEATQSWTKAKRVTRSKAELATEREQLLTALTQKVSKLSSGVDPDVFPILGKLARNLFDEGILKFEDIFAKMREILPPIFTDNDILKGMAHDVLESKAKTIEGLENKIAGNAEEPSPKFDLKGNPYVDAQDMKIGLLKKKLIGVVEESADKGATGLYARLKRMGVLSRVSTLGKLQAAVQQGTTFTALEDVLNPFFKKTATPGIKKAMEMSPRYADAGVKGIWEGLKGAYGKFFYNAETWKDMGMKLKEGYNSLDALYGRAEPNHSIWDFFGRLHGALKTPAMRREFANSLHNRAGYYAKKGIDINDPMIKFKIGAEAYADAKTAILMNDNALSGLWNQLVRNQEKKGNTAAANVMRATVPIVTVPTNYALNILDYIPGSAAIKKAIFIKSAANKSGKGLSASSFFSKNGAGMLTPEQADIVTRAYRRNGVGAGLLLLGYLKPEAFGGHYSRDKSIANPDAKPGDISIGGAHISHTFLHYPALEMMQMGATLRRAHDQGKTEMGAAASAKSLLETIPFIDSVVNLSEMLSPQSGAQLGEKLNKSIARGINPIGLSDEIAKTLDKPGGPSLLGEPIKRDAKTLAENLKVLTPGLRSQVPEKAEKRKGFPTMRGMSTSLSKKAK